MTANHNPHFRNILIRVIFLFTHLCLCLCKEKLIGSNISVADLNIHNSVKTDSCLNCYVNYRIFVGVVIK